MTADAHVMTPSEIALVLNISVDAVYTLIRNGTYPRVPYTGRTVRVSRAWFNEHVLQVAPSVRTIAEGVFS